MEPARPTAPAARNAALDVLHGFAMLGVVAVDYPMFFRPVWSEFVAAPGYDAHGLDRAARALVTFFFQTKFLTLFSVLFGVSLAILKGRFSSDEEFRLHYARRMAALFLLGAAQGVLLWYNSILVLLAAAGALALAARRLAPGELARAAGALFLLGPLGGAAMLLRGGGDSAGYLFHAGYLVGWENHVYGAGTWREVTAFRAASFLMLTPPAVLMFGLRILAMVLLGVALYDAGWFDDNPESRARWGVCVRWGLMLGTPIQLVTVWAEGLPHPSTAVLIARWASLYLGSAGLAAAYLGSICLALWTRPAWLARLRPLAAAGRMCLTNFLIAMAAGSLLAYPYGLGLYGHLGTAAAAGVGLVLYAVLVAFSAAWLERFRFGPFEWLLRAAAYRTLPSMALPAAPLRPAAASSRI